jgi:LTXXQ motif family protein
MMKSVGMAAAVSLIAAVALPLSAAAQNPQKPGNPAGAPAARPAIAAPRPAAPAFHPAPAPRLAAPAPRFSAPAQRAPVQRMAPLVRSGPMQHTAPVARGPAHVPNIARQHYEPPQMSRPNKVISRNALSRQATSRNVVDRRSIQLRQSATSLRLQQRQERMLRRAEARQLRALPPSQRAARRLEIKNAHELRAQQRLNRQTTPTIQARSALRPNGQSRISDQAVRSGRFASAFAAQDSARGKRFVPLAAHHAWRRGLRAAFVPWFGPVFWPYAYSDVFDYAFWPYGYDEGYWAYAYDDLFDGVFWGEYGPPEVYAYAPSGAARSSATLRPSHAAVQELCKQPGSGVTAWPFADIERRVGLNEEQKRLLDDVRKAANEAAVSFKASCPAENAFPLTPPGRLSAMTARLEATLQAVETVRPALDKFYDSLSDEQKERFNALGPSKPSNNPEAAQASIEAKSCKEQKPGLSNLPIARIEDVIKPNDKQEVALKDLEDATLKGVSILQAACPDETPITPPGRLEAMETRLKAMIEAAKTLKPALESFYGSLSAEQKARFNRIGREVSQRAR